MEAIAAVQARIAEIRSAFPAGASAGATAAPSANSFDAAYRNALDQAGEATASTKSGGVAAPRELAHFGNGRIPPSALTPIGVDNHRLHGPAARAFERLSDAAAADGVEIGVTDSYRSYDAQVDLARRKGLYSNGGLAATPGTSNHGWGLSLDLDLDLDPTAQTWMRANAGRFGFVEDVPREPWHWTFRPEG